MKKFFVKIKQWDKSIALAAIEAGADALVLEKGDSAKAKKLGLIETIAADGDKKLGEEVIELELKTKADEQKAAQLAKTKTVIVKAADWKVIPLENLVAQSENLFAAVASAEEAKTALGILEKGVAGVMLESNNAGEIKETGKIVKQSREHVLLEKAKITRIKQLGLGDRVCIDSCTSMRIGEGMLVGNASDAFFLVHAECVENPFVEQRPFRVNAGALHAYIIAPEGKTKYLSELKSGSEVLIVDARGNSQSAVVGRAKIEKRPLLLVEAQANGKNVSLVLQNAETIRLVNGEGKPVSVLELKEGDEVLCHLLEQGGRHFGMKIKETITEK